MTGWGEAAFDAYLPADMVLGHADIAVVVTDRLSNLLYLNEFAARLFRVSGDVARLAGCPVLSLGLFADDGVRRTGGPGRAGAARPVLGGHVREHARRRVAHAHPGPRRAAASPRR